MVQSTSLVCSSCRAALNPTDSRCSNCGAPVTGIGGARHETPVTSGNDTTFSWDAVARHLRELTKFEYEILTELGRGGMAAVYLAHEHALNRKVALKVMSPSIMMTEGMIDRFYAEAVTQANLTHANIVGVHAVRNDQDLHYFAMQYVPGRSLQQVLRSEQTAKRELPLPVIQSLLYQIGSALAYAHRRGVIHRDIKPANVILNADGDAVVTDFGIAKVASSPSHTMTGTVVGTAPYMSPEQCYAAALTGASDQYSLGIVAYELLTGNPPFLGNSFSVMQAHTLEPPPPIRTQRPDCPPEFEAVVLKMLSKRTEDRYADVNEALSALEARPASSRTGDPVREHLVRLADVAGVEAALGDVLRAPLSPMPRNRRAGAPTPPSVPRLDTPPAGQRPLPHDMARVVMLRLGDPPARVESGEVLRLEAAATDIHGTPLEGLPLRWSSSNPKIARVTSDTGDIEALAPGSADIVVSCENAVATARLVVREASVAGIVGIGIPESVEVGDRVSLRVKALDSRGKILERPVRWSMSNASSAILTGDVLTARAPGTALITATIDGTSTEFRLSVRGPSATAIEISEIPSVLGIGESIGLSASVRDKHGNVLSGRSVVWTSSEPSVADVDSRGTLSGHAGGETTLEARCDDAKAVTPVSVGIVPITTLEIAGLPERVTQGATKRIEVVAKDPTGRIRKIPAIWTSSAPNVAAIDESNQLTTFSPGHATLRVRCGSSERSFPLEVRENVAFSQRALNAFNSVPRPARSSLVKGAVALGSIAVAAALIAFIVNVGNVNGGNESAPPSRPDTTTFERPVVVEPPPVAPQKLEVTPPPVAPGDTTLRLSIDRISSMRVGDRVTPQLLATRGGTRVATPGGARWRTSNSRVLATESGRVTAVGEGTATLVARIGSATDSIFVRVDRALAGRVTIGSDPALTSLHVGDSVRARASAWDANGNNLPSPTVVWDTDPQRVATVDAGGVVRAIAQGTVRLIAIVDGARDTASLTILARPRELPPTDPVPKAPEPKAPEPKAPEPRSPDGATFAPLSPGDVANAEAEVIRAITSSPPDTARISELYARGSGDDGKRRQLMDAMRLARGRVRLIDSVGTDQRYEGERPRVRIQRTFEFTYLAGGRPRVTLDLELTFGRDGTAWRLQTFRIVNTPKY